MPANIKEDGLPSDLHLTIRDILSRADAEAPAIRAPDKAPLSYGQLLQHADDVACRLRGMGIGPNDRVAIVLPNGAEMAVAFLASTLCGTAAPLNPAYRREELDFYLNDLDAKLIIVDADASGPAIEAAVARGMAVVRVTCGTQKTAGLLVSPDLDAAVPQTATSNISPQNTAMVLHTSGTTSRPKIVPLSHRNLTSSANHIAVSLALRRDDVCLNIMPLFHIHGLVAAVLASLHAGASVVCTPGFNALRFMALLKGESPTWYTAVPTMHQAITERAARQPDEAMKNRLRFVRSSSASLPPSVLAEIEKTFGCTVVEAYGMTEAAHQMTSNPLTKAERRPGTVGRAAGPMVRVADAFGNFLPPSTEGEIVICGPNVASGYENNPGADATAFFEDGDAKARWFRTGDLGRFDQEGYLTVTGRIKELINRGGEKVAPREVDEVLLLASGVAQAVTFGYPHPKLGEEVAAAVVLSPGSGATAEGIRAFAAERLTAFKVPRKIFIVDEIPKGATGKIQRIGLAALLGISRTEGHA
ncbi:MULTISPECIES: acyl--CoA ligase [Mesorhizobium]|uniref:Acyl-CoA synthetase (AMP-forming)/AMP-acid ligase II n=1 Tax=Rhizobium loti TaxID=381 RepID=A0A8E2WG52_RHILI|nr:MULTISPECIES: acyl--CoA ligase [Mesorhizobium]PWJ93813.1 acyl-CoA synthetase (AMP-forming)/AMP-acid ligase II [Mesorhizobium loti]QKC82182.1 AMP-dependent synthetase [Mesorhizobium sp. NZP2077]QKD15655.1 AMP-binding protein [Mesorhizobium sp. NZP2077]